MSRLNKLKTFLIISIFSHSATAVIVESSVVDKTTELYSSSFSSEDISLAKNDRQANSFAVADFAVTSQSPILYVTNSIQGSLLPLSDARDNIVSYASLETSGIANRVDYHGWMVSEVGPVDVQAEDVVTVPEPSPILLLVVPLLLLLWREKLLPGIFRKI